MRVLRAGYANTRGDAAMPVRLSLEVWGVSGRLLRFRLVFVAGVAISWFLVRVRRGERDEERLDLCGAWLDPSDVRRRTIRRLLEPSGEGFRATGKSAPLA